MVKPATLSDRTCTECEATWVCSSEDEVLAEVARQARVDHGMTQIPAEIVDQVRARIVTVA